MALDVTTELDNEELKRTTADVEQKVEKKKEHVASKLPKEVQNIIQVGRDQTEVVADFSVSNGNVLSLTAYLQSRDSCARNGQLACRSGPFSAWSVT